MLVGLAGNDESVAITDVRDLLGLEHAVDSFCTDTEPLRNLRNGDRRVLLSVAGHGGLRTILFGSGAEAVRIPTDAGSKA